MVLSVNALTDVATAKDELGIPVVDTSQDARLERYINVVSQLAEDYCKRVFWREEISQETQQGYGGVYLTLDRPPINDADSSTIVIEGIVPIVSSTVSPEFTIHTRKAGILYRLSGWPNTAVRNASIAQNYAPGTEQKSILVTYDGGWITKYQAADVASPYFGQTPTLPATIEQAALLEVVESYRARGTQQNIKSEQIGDAEIEYFSGNDARSELSRSSILMLNQYRLTPSK